MFFLKSLTAFVLSLLLSLQSAGLVATETCEKPTTTTPVVVEESDSAAEAGLTGEEVAGMMVVDYTDSIPTELLRAATEYYDFIYSNDGVALVFANDDYTITIINGSDVCEIVDLGRGEALTARFTSDFGAYVCEDGKWLMSEDQMDELMSLIGGTYGGYVTRRVWDFNDGDKPSP